LTTTVGGRWTTRTVARGGLIAASTKEFALVSDARDKLEVSWLRDDATARKSVSRATKRDMGSRPVAALLTEAGEILLAVRSFFGPTAADQRLLIAGFDAKGTPLELRVLRQGDADYTSNFTLLECGSRAWLVAGVWPGGRLGIELYSLADPTPAPELIWQADDTGNRFGFEGFQTHCRDGRAALAARIDSRPSSVVLVEWKTD
jgi:hypothetical protein